ncbi:hypothetical protein ACU6TU_15895 [Halomonas sp. LS-001]
MISDPTKIKLLAAVSEPKSYCSGARRKQLQVTFDKMLDELSVKIFDEPCTNRMVFRQKVNSQSSDSTAVKALKKMLKNQDLLFSKDYRDHADEIIKFLKNDVAQFLEALRGD